MAAEFPNTDPRLISLADIVGAAIEQIIFRLRHFPRNLGATELCNAIVDRLRKAENDAESHFLHAGTEAHGLFDGRISKTQEFLGIVAASLHEAIWQYASVLVSMAENVLAPQTRTAARRDFMERLLDHFHRLPGPFEGGMEYGQWDRWYTTLSSERAAALRGDPRVDDKERSWGELDDLEQRILESFKGNVSVQTGPTIAYALKIDYSKKLKDALGRLVREGFLAKVGKRKGYRLNRRPRR